MFTKRQNVIAACSSIVILKIFNVDYGTIKTARFALETHLKKISSTYPLKSIKLFNFREGQTFCFDISRS